MPKARSLLAPVLVLFPLVAGPLAARAAAQTPYQVVPILTDMNPPVVSNLFGVPTTAAINEAGDYAFVGARNSALFYKAASQARAHRVLQIGDEVPGVPGSQILQIFQVFVNAAGDAVTRVEYALASSTLAAIIRTNGVSLSAIVTGADAAPGGGTFGASIILFGFNQSGDVLFSAVVNDETRVYLAGSGGAATRVAAPGDSAVGTGGTFTAVFAVGLADSGDALFSASITGGSGSSGLFVSRTGVVRKVVASGDANPSPIGGTFSDNFTTGTLNKVISNTGTVAFAAANSVYLNTTGGTTPVIWPTLVTPAGTILAAPHLVHGVTDNGVLLFVASTGLGGALVRRSAGGTLELIARAISFPPAPGTSSSFNGIYTVASINSAGTVSFQGNTGSTSSTPLGIFQQTVGGTLTNLWLQGEPTPVGGHVSFVNLPIRTLADGRVFLRAHIADDADEPDAPGGTHGHFLASAGTKTVLMSTDETLPGGSRMMIRPAFLTGPGSYVGFSALRAGGREGLGALLPGQAGAVVINDGDLVGGARFMFGTNNTVLVNDVGNLVLQGSLTGGGSALARSAVVLAGPTQGPTKIVADGDMDAQGRVLSTISMAGSLGVRPTPVNTFGMVAFSANADGAPRGIFVGMPGSPPAKVILTGDVVPSGTVTSIVTGSGTINDNGQVLFSASTAAGMGLYVGVGGGGVSPIALVGDAAPGGGTFSGFGATPSPGFNSAGQVAFMAATSGGSGGGIFRGSPGNLPVAIVLNGTAAPGGGNFAMTTPRPDVVISNAGDIAFVSDLSGGPGSGIFLRPATSGIIEAVVAAGDAAPGTTGTFSALGRLNGLVGQPQSLGASGHVAFRASAGGDAGWWHREPGGAMQLIMRMGSTGPEYDGGVVRNVASITEWMPGNRMPHWAPVFGAPHFGGLYLWLPAGGSLTGTGPNVVTSPPEVVTGNTPVTLTFSSVTSSGTTSLARSASGPSLPRGLFRVSGLVPYYNISTSAAFTGPVTICINFSDQSFPAGAVLRLLHHDGNAWVDVTTSGPTGSVICGTTTTLSPFVVAQALNVPAANILLNGDFSNGSFAWLTFENPYIVWTVTGGVFEFYRASSNQGVVFQSTSVPVAANNPLVAHFDLGNSSSVRKRISVLIMEWDFTDLSVCTFWLPPNAPMRTYAMRTHTTRAWTNATIAFYAATVGSNGGAYRLDNVVMGPGSAVSLARTDCVDPLEPGETTGPDSPEMLTNGSFTLGLSSWAALFTLTAQVTNGVAQFVRPSNTPPAGVLLQATGLPVAAGQIVTTRFQIGNSSAVRKRITVLLHDQSFTDLAACTFWLPPGQPLSSYTMRTYATGNWTSATISFYPATVDQAQWYEVDNVTMSVTPADWTFGTDCVEPGGQLPGVGGLSGELKPQRGVLTTGFQVRPFGA